MIKDNEFKKIKEVPGPTKEEIRSIILYKSEVKETETIVDIGCGTGGLSTEFSLKAKKVYSIDSNKEAINITKENIRKLGNIEKVELIHNDGLSALETINEKIDIGIIGGSNGDLKEIITKIDEKLNKNGRIIIPSILLDTKLESVNILKNLNYTPEIIEVNISEGKILKRGIMMLSKNPIGIVSAKKEN